MVISVSSNHYFYHSKKKNATKIIYLFDMTNLANLQLFTDTSLTALDYLFFSIQAM